jgi:hypothetical protein
MIDCESLAIGAQTFVFEESPQSANTAYLEETNVNKKIAMLLILFMVCSWCAFADDDMDGLYITLGILGGVSIVLIIILTANGEYEAAQAIIDAWQQPYSLNTNKNSFLKHASFDLSKDENQPNINNVKPLVDFRITQTGETKTFIGLQFSY